MGKLWDRDDALEAIWEWFDEHGRLPTWTEWDKAAKGRPTAKTIHRRWGWHSLLAEAVDIEPHAVRELMEWKTGGTGVHRSRPRIMAAMNSAGAELGRAPAWHEWSRAAVERPTSRTVTRRLGSWRRALVDAGFDPAPRRRSQAWQQKRLEGAARRSGAGPLVPPVLLRTDVQQRLRALGFGGLGDYLQHRYVEEGATQVKLAEDLFGRSTRSGRPEIGQLLDAYGLPHRQQGGRRLRES